MRTEIDLRQVRVARPATAALADALNGAGIDGVLNSRVTARNCDDFYTVGFAYTVQWDRCVKGLDIRAHQPSTWHQVGAFLVPELTSAVDRIYVAGAGSLLDSGALAGGLSCTYFQRLGFAAVVLGGGVRDLKELKELQMPVLASALTPGDTQGSHRVVSTGTSCVIGERTITTGDLVVSDPTGTVVIPAAIASDILARAEEIERVERSVLQRVREGVSLPELISNGGQI